MTFVRKALDALYILVVLAVFIGVLLGPRGSYMPHRAIQSSIMQASRTMALALHQYAADHNGHYPDGNSSTEIFQKLMDGNYVEDPQIFYIPALEMPGKVRPEGVHLKPENVCWDVTSPVDSSASDNLPVVFVTGYRATYSSGAPATPLIAPAKRTWFQYLTGAPERHPYFAVAYASDSAWVRDADQDGNIPKFVPADFDAKGKAYRQLTPYGIISP